MSTTTAIKQAAESLEVEVRSYSGRGMYGKTCIGFDVPHGTSPAQFAFEFAVALMEDDEHGPEAVEEFRGKVWCQDNMGLGTIVYVPGVKWDEDDEMDEDEGDDEEENQATFAV